MCVYRNPEYKSNRFKVCEGCGVVWIGQKDLTRWFNIVNPEKFLTGLTLSDKELPYYQVEQTLNPSHGCKYLPYVDKYSKSGLEHYWCDTCGTPRFKNALVDFPQLAIIPQLKNKIVKLKNKILKDEILEDKKTKYEIKLKLLLEHQEVLQFHHLAMKELIGKPKHKLL